MRDKDKSPPMRYTPPNTRTLFPLEGIEVESEDGLTKTLTAGRIYIHSDAGSGVDWTTSSWSRRTKRGKWRLDSYSVPTPVEARRKYAEYVQQRIAVEWFNLSSSSESELTHE